VNPDDPGEIAETIKAVLNDRSARTDPAHLREEVGKNFGLAVFKNNVKEIFEKRLN
jgi:glycosyltransferase involved in cell wall biosynthesis